MQHDNKIMELKKEIETKKEKLKNIEIFKPITNCVITYSYNTKKNINTMNVDELKILAINLHSDLKNEKELGLSNTKIEGFSLEDWKTDVLSKIKILDQKNELEKLSILEKQLEALLSEDKKTEIAIGKISAELLG